MQSGVSGIRERVEEPLRTMGQEVRGVDFPEAHRHLDGMAEVLSLAEDQLQAQLEKTFLRVTETRQDKAQVSLHRLAPTGEMYRVQAALIHLHLPDQIA